MSVSPHVEPSGLSPEGLFVIDCIRRLFGTGTNNGHLRDLSLDWREVTRLSLRQGLTPLVHSGLTVSDLTVPTAVRAELRAGYLGAALRAEVAYEPVLCRALAALNSRAVDRLVLKGAAFAYTVYPAPAHRPLGDIDLLVRPSALHAASAALEAFGFRVDHTEHWSPHHLRTYHVAAGQVGVEIHHDLLSESKPFRIDIDGLWARSQEATIAGVRTNVLAAADALHLVCVHLAYAHRYRWFPLRYLTDILAIVSSSREDLDWDLFIATVRRSRTGGAVYWPLHLSQKWFGAPIPEFVLADLAPPRFLCRVADHLYQPAYVLNGNVSVDSSSQVLSNLILNLSLHSACSLTEQARVTKGVLFPRRGALGHLPPHVARSRIGYAAYLARPTRLARGLRAFYRLLRQSAGQ